MKKAEDVTGIVATEVPWIATTPQSRLLASKAKDSLPGESADLPLPPQPVLPQPPTRSTATTATADNILTPDETRALESLKSLKGLGLPLAEEQENMLAQLLQKEKESTVVRSLTHGHINKLNKHQDRVDAAAKKIAVLDQEWSKFVQNIQAQVKFHADKYRQCRDQQMQIYLEKKQELENYKVEVEAASKSMLETSKPSHTPPQEVVNVEQQVKDIVSALEDANNGLGLEAEMDTQVISSEEELVMETPAALTGERKAKPVFVGSASPNKVANQNLKVKKEKGTAAKTG